MKSLTQNDFISRSNLIHKNFYDYSKTIYKNVDTKVLITCPTHGDFTQRPDHHLSGRKCKKCSFEQFHFNNINAIKMKFINESKRKWDNKYSYDKVDYKTAKDKVIIMCPIHGEFKQTPDSHLKHECIKCSTIKGSDKQRRTLREFIELSNNLHNKFYQYNKTVYISDKTKLTITCPIHGDFEQLPYNHLMGKGRGRTFALEQNGVVVSAIQILSKGEDNYEVSRFSSISLTTVIDGFAVLMEYVE